MTVTSKLDGFPILDKSSPLPSQVFVNVRNVLSSNVNWVAWPCSGEPTMIVEFHSGDRYAYLGVSRQRVVAAAHAPSVGKYINSKIKPHYECVKLV